MLRRVLLIVAALMTPTCGLARDGVIFAAASLQGPLAEIFMGPEAPVISYGASSVAARQITAGAPADLFISANPDWAATIDGKRPPQAVIGNSLVLVSRTKMEVEPDNLVAALEGARLALAEPYSVPAGQYARQALTALGVWDQVKPRVAPTQNVRAALTLVARGGAKFGVVYATDAKLSGLPVAYRFHPVDHAPIVYSAVAITDDGLALLDQLVSVPAADIFEEWGFLRLE